MRTRTGIALAAAVLTASLTAADPAAPSPIYLKECGACHVAYPPHLLPAASWRALMAGLDRHFGQNAELEPEVRAAVERWLVASAGADAGGPEAGILDELRGTKNVAFKTA